MKFIVKLKNGEIFELTTDSKDAWNDINEKLNKFDFIYFGEVIINKKEIIFVRKII
jgi:TusA-related sulfurtransferase